MTFNPTVKLNRNCFRVIWLTFGNWDWVFETNNVMLIWNREVPCRKLKRNESCQITLWAWAMVNKTNGNVGEASIQGLVVWQGFWSTLVLVLRGYHEILQGLLGSILSDLGHWEPWTFYHCQNNWFPTLLAFILTHIPCCQLSSLMEPDIQVNGWLTWPSNWFWR